MLVLCLGILTNEFRDLFWNLPLVTLGSGKDLNHRFLFIFCFNWSDQDSKAEEVEKVNEEAPRSAEAEGEGASQAGEAEEIDRAATGEAEGGTDKTDDEQADNDNEEEKPAEDGSSDEKPTEEGAQGTEGESGGDTAAEADGELVGGDQTAEGQQQANGKTKRGCFIRYPTSKIKIKECLLCCSVWSM